MMAISNQPLEQRLGQILPEADAQETLPAEDLEPMPAEVQAEPVEPPVSEPGTPAGEPLQVAVAGRVRQAIRAAAPKAVRDISPEAYQAAPLDVPPVTTEGRFKIIPEATQDLTDEVERAVYRRQAFSPLTGKPPSEAFNLNQFSDRDVAGVIAGVSDALGLQTRRVTFQQIKAAADVAGIDERFITRVMSSEGRMLGSSAEMYRALELLDISGGELDRMFKLVASGQATDAEKLQLRQQIAFHGTLQKAVKGIQSETARALAIFRIPRDGGGSANVVRQVLDEYGGDQSLTDMAKAYLSLESRARRNELVEKSTFSGLKDVWMSTWINGLLSGPLSHAKNIIGNSLFGLYQIPERAVAALYSNVLPKGVRSWRELVPGSADEQIGLDEALTMIQSMRNGLVEGFQLASEAFRKNQPSDLLTKIEQQRVPQETMGETLQRITGVAPDTWMGKAMDYYGTAVTLPGRALMTEDEFFKGTFYRMHLNTLVERRGKAVYRDAIGNGMPEADAIKAMETEVANLLAHPPRDLDEAAMDYARRGTFTAELPPGLKALQGVFNTPALKIIVPFFKTPANISLEVIERTPFAPLSSKWRQEMAAGGVSRDMALAKVTLGSSVLATYALLAAEGHITGSGPKRQADREALERDGWRPYSIKIGDKYYSYGGLEPVGALLAIAADYAEYARHEPDSTKVEQVFMGATFGLYEYLKEQPYLQGIGDIARLIGSGTPGQPVDGAKIVNELAKQYGGFVIGGSPGGAYGSLVASIERMGDPAVRDPRLNPDLPMGIRGLYEAWNRYRSRLPYFSEAIPESLNLWGDVRVAGTGAAYELILPTRVTKEQFSEVDDALWRIGSPVGMPERKIQGVEMDAFQFNQLLTIYGKELNAKEELGKVMREPGFALLNRQDQQKAVQSVHSKLMDYARKTLIDRDPALQAKITELEELKRANGMYYKP
jgi:hypothetical protein